MDNTPPPMDIQLKGYSKPADPDNMFSQANAREQYLREVFIANEIHKMKREELDECYKREGVNHIQNCKKLALELKAMIEDPMRGVLQPPQPEA
mmetsp:Transcript_15432/g.22697  ORF Transcript_15432/g.22697 Transcript_15432/m.22697 type:complete len:94 (+) Transcript_15432:96-377(+)|eukprot:CAMPEP_0113934958 /NCGR_PEP_ID=MMETSP1339-20121228/2200_1 /TAXON_ID=94617 /ORGANISM="Fibrocapsa japonica" /LENGTH=93 /DNA_ID=CAMNT_0000936941 /DNA_START=94 /DNA_END=375 /DNA_ORIENTATION=+ /assembly_acc=CAM_ASM_000762